MTSYYLRTRHGASTVTEAIRKCYGSLSVLLYLIFIVYRLNFEVWSNTAVVASFFVPNGVIQTDVWWAVCAVAAAAPMIYICMGGFRTSLTTDMLQALLHLILLCIIVGYSFGGMPGGGDKIFTYGADWTLKGGMDLFCVGLLQGFISYPFFDPILMDRTFLSTPKTMVAAFFTAGTLSMVFIWFFGTLGVYGKATVKTGNPATVAHHLGESVFLVVTLIMMSSQLTAVDSCFVSTGRYPCVGVSWGVVMGYYLPSLLFPFLSLFPSLSLCLFLSLLLSLLFLCLFLPSCVCFVSWLLMLFFMLE